MESNKPRSGSGVGLGCFLVLVAALVFWALVILAGHAVTR